MLQQSANRQRPNVRTDCQGWHGFNFSFKRPCIPVYYFHSCFKGVQHLHQSPDSSHWYYTQNMQESKEEAMIIHFYQIQVGHCLPLFWSTVERWQDIRKMDEEWHIGCKISTVYDVTPNTKATTILHFTLFNPTSIGIRAARYWK